MHATTPFLVDEIAAFRRVRDQTLRLVEGLSQEEFDWSPALDKWSIGEVLDHVLRAEQFFRRDLERLAEGSRSGRPMHIRHTFHDLDIGLPFVPRSLMPALDIPLTLATLFVPAAVLNILTASRLFAMRHPSVADPQHGRSAESIREDLWDACRQTFEFLQRLSPRDAASMTVSHPLLGTRTVPELIRFMLQHERRHQGQVADLKERMKALPASVSVQWKGFGSPTVSADVPRKQQVGDRSERFGPDAVIDRRRDMVKRTTVACAPGTEVYEQDAIRGVYRCISEAWEKGDARGVVANFAEDGNLIDPFGRVARGREAVAALLAGNFAGMFHGSRIVFDPQTFRILSPEVAVADGTWQVTLPQAPGGPAPPEIAGLITTVFRKADGTWKVEADRPMLKAPLPPNPPRPKDSPPNR